jgi:hypothetical protein
MVNEGTPELPPVAANATLAKIGDAAPTMPMASIILYVSHLVVMMSSVFVFVDENAAQNSP